PSSVVVLGFEKHDPAAARLGEALRARGRSVTESLAVEEPRECTVRTWKAPTVAAELRTVAVAVRERLLAEPGLRVAVLAPDLRAYASRIERVLEEELDPAGLLDAAGTSVRRFDFAEAPGLADYAMIASALDLLSLTPTRIPFETASRVLL